MAASPQEIKLFGKWSYDDVEVLRTQSSGLFERDVYKAAILPETAVVLL